ncbi:glycosyltransferase family 4 protein [Patescibacteria group bacterium]|nr:glycosyltransferase family 4 protein [Patescibacteria group bacterium]
MKILMPVLHYPPVIGGFEVFIENICEELRSTQDIWMLTGKVKGRPAIEKKERLTILRTASLFELQDYSYSSYFYIFTMLPVLMWQSWRIIRQEKIQLLHAQGFFSGIICWILNIFTKVPYIITIQSADFNIYHSEIKSNLIVRLQAWVERQVYKNAKICHAVSQDLCAHFGRQGRGDAVMIPNGVETKIFKPIDGSLKAQVRKEIGVKSKYLISCVSRLQEKNGTHDLVQAVKILKDMGFDVECAILGDGQERGRLEKMVEELGIKEKVHFLGQIMHEDAGKFVAASDIFVRPSLAEGFGIVFLEAMACGVPVIGTPVGGIVDFLKDGETGLICKPGKPEDLADKCAKLLSDAQLYAIIKQNSFRMLEEEYCWSSLARKINDLYL